MSQSITLDQLSAEQKAELLKQAKEEVKSNAQKVKDERTAYKKMVNEAIPSLFNELVAVSKALSQVKAKVFSELAALVVMKQGVYGRDGNISHTFTTDDGITLSIGHRQLDGWDDTVSAGIQKVYKYLESLAKDENSQRLVKTIMQLLAKDNAGNLKASRVLQLKKMAEEMADPEFIDAIQIIQDAYRPTRSKEFVTAIGKSEAGIRHQLPLDITDAGFEFNAEKYVPTKTQTEA